MAGQTQATVQVEYQSPTLSARGVQRPRAPRSLQAFGHHPQDSALGPDGIAQLSAHQYALPLRSYTGLGHDLPRNARLPAPEDHLRRKTPGGTLDAAYDGTTSFRSANSRPVKHLILPSSSMPIKGGDQNQHEYHCRAQPYALQAPAHPLSSRHVTGASKASEQHYRFPPGLWPQYHDAPPSLPPSMYLPYDSGPNTFLGPQQVYHYPRHDQRVANVAQPPLPTPLALQHPPALLNPTYCLYGMSSNSWPGSWDCYQHHDASLAAINQNISGLSLADPNAYYNFTNPSVPNAAPRDNGRYQSAATASWPVPRMPTFAERDRSLSSGQPISTRSFTMDHELASNYAATGRQHEQRHEVGGDSDSKRPFPSPVTPSATAHDILTRAHTLYLSLISAIQQARKFQSSIGENPPSKSQNQSTQIYPEPVRKCAVAAPSYTQMFPFEQDSNPWLVGKMNGNHKDSSMSTQQLHSGLVPQHHSSTGPRPTRGSVNSGFYPATDNQLQPSMDHNLPAPELDLANDPYCQKAPPQQVWSPHSPSSSSVVQLMGNASNALDQLTILCQDCNPPWLDGMLLAGCLAYVLGNFKNAAQWFRLILKHDARHIEATSNLAATLLACNRRREAEQYWRLTLKLQPSYFDGAEHLIGLLCGEQRHKEAVEVVEYVQRSLRIDVDVESISMYDPGTESSNINSQSAETTQNLHSRDYRDLSKSQGQIEHATFVKSFPKYYRVADADKCRIIALIHAKGNIMYSLQDHAGAARAFEEVVMIATGLRTGSLRDLIEWIRSKLQHGISQKSTSRNEPLLLSPERALLTSKLCFGPTGDLPGLGGVTNRALRKAAVSVTSNSLLSLAKIYQDGMSSNTEQASKLSENFGIHDILVLYYLSLSLQPSPSTANNVGILLASVQRTSPANDVRQSKDEECFMFPGVVPGSGTALALTYYRFGLNLDSKHAHLFTNLGSLLKDIGQLSLAIKMYEKAVACDGNFDIALANLANAVKDQGKTADAIVYYKKAVQVNPNFAEAVCGLANALNSVCSWAGRGGIIINDGNLDRWHVDQNGSLVDSQMPGSKGSGWVRRVMEIVDSQLTAGELWGRGKLDACYIHALCQQLGAPRTEAKKPSKHMECSLTRLLQSWQDQKWEGPRIVRFLERAVKRLGWAWYQDKYVKRNKTSSSAYRRPQLPSNLSSPSAPTVLPFHTFTFPMSAEQIRLISQRNGLRVSYSSLRAPWLPQTVYPPPAPPNPHLNIGYVSSDFNNHPLAHLMQSVFGMHDTRRVKAFCYATTASDKSVHRKQIEDEAQVFYDASGWPTERLVEQVVKDQIHILVNLNGYTRGARNEVFAARPAPIQMSFMGFAGTLGAEWCDYLLADEVAVPPATLRPWRRNVDLEDLAHDDDSGSQDRDWVYGENIVYTRDTFFCCDHRQTNASQKLRDMTWDEERRRRWKMRKELFPQLADDAVIFGNFNQLYKIDPTTFRTWLRILSRVPNAVLWLLRFPDVGEQHLRATAAAWAGPSVAARILFTDVAPKAVHIARACVADLFLDTPECNAHTTAADCLWSGTPLLTLPRYRWKMCSRMAASILGGALPQHTIEGQRAWQELVVGGEDEYEDAAVRLGKGLRYPTGDPGSEEEGEWGFGEGRLTELRKIIWAHRWECKLFDTRRWVSDLEVAYEEAWRRWVAGEGGDIWLKDLL